MNRRSSLPKPAVHAWVLANKVALRHLHDLNRNYQGYWDHSIQQDEVRAPNEKRFDLIRIRREIDVSIAVFAAAQKPPVQKGQYKAKHKLKPQNENQDVVDFDLDLRHLL